MRKKFISFLMIMLFLSKAGFCSEEITKYLLPQDHRLRTKLDKIFTSEDVLESKDSLKEAGFTILYNKSSGMKVARHPSLPGYLIKTYLNSAKKGEKWAIDRCKGAENIRNLIEEEGLNFFSVPDKWIYLVAYPDPLTVVLVVEDMQLVSKEKTKKAWKNVSKRQMEELYTILNHGFASCYLIDNIPYTKKEKFSCVDTAYPYRKFSYNKIKEYFSPKMQKYWDKLVKSSENQEQ